MAVATDASSAKGEMARLQAMAHVKVVMVTASWLRILMELFRQSLIKTFVRTFSNSQNS